MVGRLCVCQLLLSQVAMLWFQMYGRPTMCLPTVAMLWFQMYGRLTMCLPTVAKSSCYVMFSDVWSADYVFANCY